MRCAVHLKRLEYISIRLLDIDLDSYLTDSESRAHVTKFEIARTLRVRRVQIETMPNKKFTAKARSEKNYLLPF